MWRFIFEQATGTSSQWKYGVDLGSSEPFWAFFNGMFLAMDCSCLMLAMWLAYLWLFHE